MRPSKIKLVVFDLDDTLTTGPTIWERIHWETGTWDSHGDPYWEDFKKGRFGYNAFIRKDVLCWKGLKVSEVKKAIRRMKYIPKLKETLRALRKKGIKTALVSSSIEIFADYVSKKFGIDHVHANSLEAREGKLTGKVILKVPGGAKGRLVRRLKKRLKLKKREILAVGDSEYDIPMFKEVGTSVTFKDAKPLVKRLAGFAISKRDLPRLLGIIERRSR
jgi:phosphoserine phosphatase